jgi:hypothetical protein
MIPKNGHGPGKEAMTQTATIETHSQSCRDSYGCQAPAQQNPLSLPFWTNKTRLPEKVRVKKGHAVEPLKTEFTLSGFTYRQIAREGDWAIFEQRWRDGENVCYEAVRIRRVLATTFPSGRSYPEREVYPPSETWGVDGFTVTDRNKAWAKFFEISLEEPARKRKEVK